MRRLLGAGLLALTGAMGTAFAADLSAPPLPTTKGPAPAPPYNWTGFYVGVNAGGDWYGGNGFVGGSNIQSLLPANRIINIPANRDRTDPGFTAGGLAGYNYQIGSFVVGGETDFNYIDSQSHRSGSTSIRCCGGATETLSFDSKSQLDWFGTARARLGYVPTERLLVYATGGLGYGEVERSLEFSNISRRISGRNSGKEAIRRLAWAGRSGPALNMR
jgi:outer membrane immunogenic protein